MNKLTEQQSFYDSTQFEWTKLLQENWQDIRAELDNIVNNPVDTFKDDAWISAYPSYTKNAQNISSAWRSFTFYFFCIKHLGHAKLCPKTSAVLDKIPNLVSAEFSLLQAETHIEAHTGFTDDVLRCHTGLLIPDEQLCGIRVGSETRHWQEGEVLIFNDFIEHEAWNKSDKKRAILMLDFANPAKDLSPAQIAHKKLSVTKDPFLMAIAPSETWLQWLEQGYFEF